MNNTTLSLQLLVRQQYLIATFIARIFVAIGTSSLLLTIIVALITRHPEESLRIAALSGFLFGLLVTLISAIYIAIKEYQLHKRLGNIKTYVLADGSINPTIRALSDFKFLDV